MNILGSNNLSQPSKEFWNVLSLITLIARDITHFITVRKFPKKRSLTKSSIVIQVDMAEREKQQWAAWKQQQTLKQLEAFKLDVQNPFKPKISSNDILSNQKPGALQNSEDMIKNGVLTKFARRKLKNEQETVGNIVDQTAAPGAIASPSVKFDCYNEVGWLKVEVRRLEGVVKKLREEKSQLVQEKSLWFSKFHDENKKLHDLLSEVKITRMKLTTEISDFEAQRNALRSIEVNAADRKLYDICVNKLPLPAIMPDITSGNKKLKAMEVSIYLVVYCVIL